MPTLAEIVSDRASVAFEGDDGNSLTIHYRPRQASTTHMMRLARDLERFKQESATIDEALDIAERLGAALCSIVIAWDLMEADGVTPVALTPARLDSLDLMLQFQLYGLIMQDARRSLGEPNGTRSQTPTNGTSTPRAARTTSRTGASRKR